MPFSIQSLCTYIQIEEDWRKPYPNRIRKHKSQGRSVVDWVCNCDWFSGYQIDSGRIDRWIYRYMDRGDLYLDELSLDYITTTRAMFGKDFVEILSAICISNDIERKREDIMRIRSWMIGIYNQRYAYAEEEEKDLLYLHAFPSACKNEPPSTFLHTVHTKQLLWNFFPNACNPLPWMGRLHVSQRGKLVGLELVAVVTVDAELLFVSWGELVLVLVRVLERELGVAEGGLVLIGKEE